MRSFIPALDAKTNIRDYHGKMAVHYWKGSSDVFNQPNLQPGQCCYSKSPASKLRILLVTDLSAVKLKIVVNVLF